MQPNAFIGRTEKPTDKELAAALGPLHKLWEKLIADLDLPTQEWSSYSPKAGWALKIKKKDRNILYLSPCQGCFRASFALGDKAVREALKSELPEAVLELISHAKRYAEGTAVRIEVHDAKDVDVIKKLAAIKLSN